MMQRHIAIVVVELSMWAMFALWGIWAHLHGFCARHHFPYYLITVGITNTFFTVYRAMAIDVFYAVTCVLVVLVAGVLQILLNVVSTAFAFIWFSSYLEVLFSDFRPVCDGATVYVTIALLLFQCIFAAVGTFCLQKILRQGIRSQRRASHA